MAWLWIGGLPAASCSRSSQGSLRLFEPLPPSRILTIDVGSRRAPFGDIGDKSKWEIYSKAANGKFKFPSFVSKPARELITQLLQRASLSCARDCVLL